MLSLQGLRPAVPLKREQHRARPPLCLQSEPQLRLRTKAGAEEEDRERGGLRERQGTRQRERERERERGGVAQRERQIEREREGCRSWRQLLIRAPTDGLCIEYSTVVARMWGSKK